MRRSPLPSEGVNLFYADGEAAFQEVFHSHLHVFPRSAGDGFRISARWGSNPHGRSSTVSGGDPRGTLTCAGVSIVSMPTCRHATPQAYSVPGT